MNPNRTVSLDTTSDGIRQEDKPTPRLALELTAVLNRLFQCCVVEYVICLSNAIALSKTTSWHCGWKPKYSNPIKMCNNLY